MTPAVRGGGCAERGRRPVCTPCGRWKLTSLVERLAQVMQAAFIPIWLIKPIERLDDRRPIDVIRAGDYRSVLRLVASLEGMPVS